MASQSRPPSRYGPKPLWGDEDLWPCKIHWPESHREMYAAEAKKAGLSLNQYVIRCMAAVHELPGPREEYDPQIALTSLARKKSA